MTSLRLSQGQNGIINLASLYRCPEFHFRVIAPPCRYLWSLSTGTYSFHLSPYVPGPTFVKQVELVTAIHAAGLKWLLVALEFLDLALATVEGLSLPPGMVVVFDPPGLDSYTGAQPSPSGLMDGADEADFQNTNEGKDVEVRETVRIYKIQSLRITTSIVTAWFIEAMVAMGESTDNFRQLLSSLELVSFGGSTCGQDTVEAESFRPTRHV
ncbi:hypothetical protein NHJ13051_008975 [Beauveria bassiana]